MAQPKEDIGRGSDPGAAGEPPLTLVPKALAGALRALVRSSDTEQQLRAALSGQGGVRLELLRGSLGEQVGALTAQPRPDAVLIDVDISDPSQLLMLRKLVGGGLAGVPVLVTASSAGVEEMRQLMRLQIADFLPQPLVQAEIMAGISAAFRKTVVSDGASRPQCRVISVVHRSGGMGATFIAIQVALELLGGKRKEARPHVCLVDLDTQSGDSATYLDVDGNLDLPAIARAPERLDLSLLQSMVSHHGSGLHVLAPRAGLTEIEAVTPDAVAGLLDLVCGHYDYVVIDLPETWTLWSLPVLAGSDAVLVVTQLSVAAVKQAKALLDKLAAEGMPAGTVNVVLNRLRRGLLGRGVKRTTAERALGRPFDFTISDDPRLVTTALDHGQTLQQIKSGSTVEKELRAMVGHLLLRLVPAAGQAQAKQARRA
jgi:pilus assembly protein CpaE